jgi:uncharacterized protein (TIGR04222 family)
MLSNQNCHLHVTTGKRRAIHRHTGGVPMKPKHETLWSRIENAPLISESGDRQMAARLADEHGWTSSHTTRVIYEYRRFLFLAVGADHVVSPSDPIDQVWHLHLLHTRAYQAYCRDILGRPLHHQPSNGEPCMKSALRKQYMATIHSYRELFGEDPPGAIWPSAAWSSADQPGTTEPKHSQPANAGWQSGVPGAMCRWHAIAHRAWWVLSRSQAFNATALAAPMSCVVVATVHAKSAAQRIAHAITDLHTSWLLIIGCLAGAALLRRPHRGPHAGPEVGFEHLRPYEIAYLAGGHERLWSAVLTRLRMRGLSFTADGVGGVHTAGQQLQRADDIERSVIAQLSKSVGSKTDVVDGFSQIRDRLAELGLLAPASAKARRIAARLLLATSLLLMFSHMHLVAPASWSLLAVAFVAVTGVVSLLCHEPPLRSRRGDAALRSIEQIWPVSELQRLLALTEGEQKLDAGTLATALFGVSTSARGRTGLKETPDAGVDAPSASEQEALGDVPGCCASCGSACGGGCGGCAGCGG